MDLVRVLIIIIYIYYIYRCGKDGLSYIFFANLVFAINFIGNLYLEKSIFAITNINFIIFILLHNYSYGIFSKRKINIFSYNSVFILKNRLSIKIIFIICLLAIAFFYYKVGFLVFQDNPLIARDALGFGHGIFSRIILYIIPILAGIYIGYFFINKRLSFIIFPLLSVFIVFLTGYRGYMMWTAIYFIIIINYFKKINPFNVWILLASGIFVITAVLITQQYFVSMSFSGAFDLFIKRIFQDNVYGYNILINQYIKVHPVTLNNMNALPVKMFAWNFGDGRLVDLDRGFTVTLPGMTYALGGIFLTIIISLGLGSVAGIIEKINKLSHEPTHLAFRSFLLFSLITLINRGYIGIFFTIPILSGVFIYCLVLFFSRVKLRYGAFRK